MDVITFHRSTFAKLEICKVGFFCLILVGNQSSLILAIKNSDGGGGGLGEGGLYT